MHALVRALERHLRNAGGPIRNTSGASPTSPQSYTQASLLGPSGSTCYPQCLSILFRPYTHPFSAQPYKLALYYFYYMERQMQDAERMNLCLEVPRILASYFSCYEIMRRNDP